jgi:hypothetical protein
MKQKRGIKMSEETLKDFVLDRENILTGEDE